MALLRCERVDEAIALLSPEPSDASFHESLEEPDLVVLATIKLLLRLDASSDYDDFDELLNEAFHHSDEWWPWIADISVAVELGKWPRIAAWIDEMTEIEFREEASHARFVRAWIAAVFGDTDVAAATFDELLALAQARGDLLSLALAERGLALVASHRGDDEAVHAALQRVAKLEGELGLPDAGRVAALLTAHAST